MKSHKILFFVLIVAAGCQSPIKERVEKPVKNVRNDLQGIWENVSMKITYTNSDSVFVVPEGKWEEILSIMPIRTTYKPDSTYKSNYYKLDGTLLFTSEGFWEVQKDTLIMTSREGVANKYHFKKTNELGKFVGVIDWDGDGVSSELYEGVQKKL